MKHKGSLLAAVSLEQNPLVPLGTRLLVQGTVGVTEHAPGKKRILKIGCHIPNKSSRLAIP